MNSIKWNLIPKKYLLISSGGFVLVVISTLTKGMNVAMIIMAFIGWLAVTAAIGMLYLISSPAETLWWHKFILSSLNNTPILITDFTHQLMGKYLEQTYDAKYDTASINRQIQEHLDTLIKMKYVNLLEDENNTFFLQRTRTGITYFKHISSGS